ncbi:MAG: AAA family ATPase [Blastocatellia bacterium]|nr:AAA family ATPase [Blastocatellia bacterium]
MTSDSRKLIALHRPLENGTYLAEALFFPEFSRLEKNLTYLNNALRTNAAQIAGEIPPFLFSQRHVTEEPEVAACEVEIVPPKKSVTWRTPLSVRFEYIWWTHGEFARIAYVPAFQIEVIAPLNADLGAQVQQEILAEVKRQKLNTTLDGMMWLARFDTVQVRVLSYSPDLETPKKTATRKEEPEEKETSILGEVGVNLTWQRMYPAYEVEDVVQKLADALTGKQPKSVLLVGPSGVGKTAVLHELVRRRSEFHLSHTPFWATSGARLVAGMTGYGMWQERCQKLWREAAKDKAIIHFGNLFELLHVGKSEGNDQGIAGFFKPYLMRREFLAVAECTPEQIPLIEREDPRLLEAFFQIRLEEFSPEKGKAILLMYLADRFRVAPIDSEGIDTLDRLHRRYATYSSYPGRPLRFLKHLTEARRSSDLIARQDVTRAFSDETGLPLFLLEDSIPLDLEKTHQWFSEKVVGQPEAVNLVVELLATVKAGLARPRKPIASLLFIGPTGVGKTEMAKTLAEFLFQDRNRMVRFDMSEFSDPYSVKRLIGGIFESEGLLTAKVREQPFSVILFDEFEKADPAFYDLLLQVLGEGRLTDAAGRVADFCNSVVIMTSNLGAESFQRGNPGFLSDREEQKAAQRHFVREVQKAVRPELFNRIDRIVSFSPLDRPTVLKIADRELAAIRQRDGLKYRSVNLAVPSQAADYLVEKCYDAKFGARPLKRALERELLRALSVQLNQYSADLLLECGVRLDGAKLTVEAKASGTKSRQHLSALASDALFLRLAEGCTGLRRKAQTLDRCPAVLEYRNEVYRLERLARTKEKKSWMSEEVRRQLAKLPHIKTLLNRVKDFLDSIMELENRIFLAFYGKETVVVPEIDSQLNQVQAQWKRLMIDVHCLKFYPGNRILLAFYAENHKKLFEMAQMYFKVAENRGFTVNLHRYVSGFNAVEVPNQQIVSLFDRRTKLEPVDDPSAFFKHPVDFVHGILLAVQGEGAVPTFAPEQGIHLFPEGQHGQKCLLAISEKPVEKYKPGAELAARGSIANQFKRRTYDAKEKYIEDHILKIRYDSNGRAAAAIVEQAIETRLFNEAESLLS